MSLVDTSTGEVVAYDQTLAHPAADLFPLLGGDDLSELAEDIKTHGQREPIVLYDDPELGTVVLDGRNRARACVLAGVEIQTRFYTGDDPITFSISQNAKRRHLSAGQRAAVAYAALPLYEAEARRRMAEAGASAAPGRPVQKPGADLPQVSEPPAEVGEDPVHGEPARPRRAARSRERAGKSAGASGRAVAQYKRLAEEAPDLAEQVKAGTATLNRAERIVRDRAAEAARVAQAKADAETADEVLTVDIRQGDFREVLSDLRDVDAIITDPPYPFEFLPLLDDLAAWADKVLTADGVMAVLIGQTHLPDVYRRLEGHRPYRWTGCYLTSGPGYVSHPRKVQSSWKPLLVYGGGPRISDVIRSSGDDKGHHKWGQNYDAFHSIVERLTTQGQTVVDPFMGGGTTLLAAHALGRHTIGCDIDPEAVETARERLS